MEVHVKITKTELEKYKEYAHIQRKMNALCNNKCGPSGSSGRSACCGCPEQRELCNLLKKTGIEDYNKSGIIENYVEMLLDFCDARIEFDRATERLNTLRRECDAAYRKFEVLD